MLGADAVAKAPADGYTLLIGTNSTNAALKSLMKKLPYDQDTAFAPVGYLGSVPLIVAINNDVPAKTLREFVDLAKAKPNEVTFASASTSQLVSSEMLASMAGIQMTNVPYKSGPAAMTDLLGGQVMMFSADFAVTLPQVKAGKIRGLAVTSTKRSAAIPELPTVNEALGLKDYELIAYFAFFAPAGTPPEAIAKLNTAINAAANTKDLQDKFAAIGFAVEPGTPESLGQRTQREQQRIKSEAAWPLNRRNRDRLRRRGRLYNWRRRIERRKDASTRRLGRGGNRRGAAQSSGRGSSAHYR
jgi:tripartite-type tricarboxylate transporter receptor subunit TctC